jgi:hypothetical protein
MKIRHNILSLSYFYFSSIRLHPCTLAPLHPCTLAPLHHFDMWVLLLLGLGLGLVRAVPIEPMVTRNFTYKNLENNHYSTTEKVIFPEGFTMIRRINGTRVPIGIQLSWRSNLIWSPLECSTNCTVRSQSWSIIVDPSDPPTIWYNLPEGKGKLTGALSIKPGKSIKSKRQGRTPVAFWNPMTPSSPQASLSVPLFIGCSISFILFFAVIIIMVRARKAQANYYLLPV